MIVTPFRAADWRRLDVHASQKRLAALMSDARLEQLETEYVRTFSSDGEVVMVAGVAEYYPGRAELWAFLGAHAGRHMRVLTRKGRAFLNGCEHRRVEATIDFEFDAGHRWVRMLGFACEAAIMKAYRIDGGNSSLYARVRTV